MQLKSIEKALLKIGANIEITEIGENGYSEKAYELKAFYKNYIIEFSTKRGYIFVDKAKNQETEEWIKNIYSDNFTGRFFERINQMINFITN